MTDRPSLTLTTINIGSPDPATLAHFYARLLGWEVARVEETDAHLRNPAGGISLSFQLEDVFTPPAWPNTADHQQMMMHLDIRVTDLDTSVGFALGCGATLAQFQPQEDVRVCLDPHGHPFCLWLG
ncbi:VOC family protein [Occultella glacieicola]|uniref:VOC family protein n=1 Tax=Occultella glacieicola TaxID=2518684 RepID=A0ABY2E6P6_9MICO|nr:VOC family protein [Occultella glacieicola]TDE97219.1 VOC family protein [Occultella glacieicola]